MLESYFDRVPLTPISVQSRLEQKKPCFALEFLIEIPGWVRDSMETQAFFSLVLDPT